MARAKDVGPQFPADTNDSAPADPTSGRVQLDYPVTKLTRPTLSDMSKDGQVATIIDIDTTVIKSSVRGRSTTMSTLVSIFEDESQNVKLALKSNAPVVGFALLAGGEEAVERLRDMTFKFDETDDEWRPSGSFLASRPIASEE